MHDCHNLQLLMETHLIHICSLVIQTICNRQCCFKLLLLQLLQLLQLLLLQFVTIITNCNNWACGHLPLAISTCVWALWVLPQWGISSKSYCASACDIEKFFLYETTVKMALYIILVGQMMNEMNIGQAPKSCLHVTRLLYTNLGMSHADNFSNQLL